ncbi:MAG: hypothetical protein ACRCV3_05670 [Desulfovibrionaceae bacterium]
MSSLLITSTLHSALLPPYLSSIPLFYPAVGTSEGKITSSKLPYTEEEASQYILQLHSFLSEKRIIPGTHQHCLDFTFDEIDLFSENKKSHTRTLSQKAHSLLLIAYIQEEQYIALSLDIENFNHLCTEFQTLFTSISPITPYISPIEENSFHNTEYLLFAALTHFTANDIVFVSPSVSLFELCQEKGLIQNIPPDISLLCNKYNITPYAKGYIASSLEDFLPSFGHLSSGDTIRCIFCFEENI